MSVDPNATQTTTGVTSFANGVYSALKSPLDFPQEFTQWIYAIVANPVLRPASVGTNTIAAPLTQSYADSGHTDFFSQGVYTVEAKLANSIIGGALVYCGLDTGGTNKTVVIMASGVASDGVAPTFSVQNNTSSTAVFRTLTSGATGSNVTVTYRRSTVTS